MKTIAALFVLAAAGTAANAQTWAEVGDAGQSVADVQMTSPAGPLTSITGSMANGTDFDLYCIHLNGGDFRISTTVFPGGDSVLALFNANGTGVLYNDDIVGGSSFLSLINGNLPAGDYILGVWGYTGVGSAQSAGGSIWNAGAFRALRAPDGPGAAGALTGFTGSHGTSGAYTIVMENVNACPTPGAAALLGLGGLAGFRRRRA